MNLFQELPTGAQVAYSEAFDVARHADLHRSIASLNGSFQSKDIKGKTYWYFAYRDALDGKVRQIYVGPDSEKIEALKAKAAEPPKDGLVRQAGAALAHGCASVLPKHFRIIRQLSDARFFQAGGLVIGSHAYIALGNLLGVRWEESTHTLDIDFAHAGPRANISVALPADVDIDVHSAIESLEMGFLPSLGFSGNSLGTYVSDREPELRLDFLTPLRREEKAVECPNLKVALQPLKFLEFLIERPTQAVLLSEQGAIVVNVPDPARFALHKLIVTGERPMSERLKSHKDLVQAASVINYLLEQDHADHLREVYEDLDARGPGWRSRFNRGLERMTKLYPAVGEQFLAEVKEAARPTP